MYYNDISLNHVIHEEINSSIAYYIIKINYINYLKFITSLVGLVLRN